MEHHVSPLVIFIISFCYFVFSAQVVYQSGWENMKKKKGRAILYLASVFIFCSLAGYVSTPLPASWLWAREALHWILAVASILLVTSNQAGITR